MKIIYTYNIKGMKVMVEALIVGIIMHSQNTLFF